MFLILIGENNIDSGLSYFLFAISAKCLFLIILEIYKNVSFIKKQTMD